MDDTSLRSGDGTLMVEPADRSKSDFSQTLASTEQALQARTKHFEPVRNLDEIDNNFEDFLRNLDDFANENGKIFIDVGSSDRFDEWEEKNEALIEGYRLKYEYDPRLGQMIITIPTPYHEAGKIMFADIFRLAPFDKLVRCYGSVRRYRFPTCFVLMLRFLPQAYRN